MNMKNGKQYIIWIDSLKGIAICGIIMIHSGGAHLPSILGRIGDMGKYGVELFFILSAYLAYVSMASLNMWQNNGNRKTIVRWWIKKFLRLAPMYYLSLAICIFVPGAHSSYWLGEKTAITLWNILAHIFFLHGFFPHYVNSIVGVEWYLAVLVVFYICVPIIYKYICSLERAIASFVVISIICFLMNKFISLYLPETGDAYIYSSYIGTFSFFVHLPTLLLGVIFYFLTLDNLKRVVNRKLLSYSLLLFALIMLGGQVYNRNSLSIFNTYTLFAFWFIYIALSQVLWRCPLLNNCFWARLGKYSYPIYLFHYPLILLYDTYISVKTGYIILDWGIKYIFVTLITLYISYIVTKFIDIPIKKWINLKIQKII